jgi:hypothetical protein
VDLPTARRRLLGASAIVALALAGCGRSDDRPQGAPPPPPPSTKPAACAGGGGTLADTTSASLLPRTTGSFCLDPNGGDKAFGEGAPLPIDHICDLFDGECEIYRGYGVRRVLEARYVDGAGTPATVDAHLSKFGTSDGAYAMFTRRVVGDGDPADDSTPRPIEGGGAAALGVGNAYVWRGQYLLELTYNDQTAAEAAVKAAGDKLLPPLAKDVGGRLAGEPALPAAALALPKADQIPLGVRFSTKDMLGVDGAGAGAFGYYKAGAKRWRVAAIVRADVDQAKDVLATFAKQAGASKEKGVGDGAVRLMRKDGEGAAVEWVMARAGKVILGLGDEPRVLRANQTAEEHAKVTLTKDEKLQRLKSVLPGG